MQHATSSEVQWWYPFIMPFWLFFIVGLLPNPFELIPFVTFLEIPDMILTIICLITLHVGLKPAEKLAYRQAITHFWDIILERKQLTDDIIEKEISPSSGTVKSSFKSGFTIEMIKD